MEIMGQASTSLPHGLVIDDDKKTEDVSIGVSIFECKIPFDDSTRDLVAKCTEVGNYILRSHENENEFYTIIETETNTKKQTVYIYAEDAGMDLLNEVVGPYEADKAYPISHYINKYVKDAGFVIGVNEVASLTRKLSWDGDATATERILSIATQFGGCELSFSFDVEGLEVVKKYVDIHKERGADTGEQLRLNKEIDSIVTTKTIENLATALQCTGGTPENEESPITLKNYKYDDGDFYVDGTTVKSRQALKQWSRLLWKDDGSTEAGGHITKQFSYDTISQEELCSRAITELKKIRDTAVNYDAEIKELPASVRVGDRVNIIDDAGELYLSTRLLTLETSVCDKSRRAILGEYLIKGSGISEKVEALAAKFAKNAVSAARALSIANNAQAQAQAANATAQEASEGSQQALSQANQAQDAAGAAMQYAQAAEQAASNAQQAVDSVEESVSEMEQSVADANAAAKMAQQAAASAETKATEAHTASVNAGTKADEAKQAAETAAGKADTATETAGKAKTEAESAISKATEAATTAAAAKQDAKAAQDDIDNLGESLTTLESTMKANYARKTDLTEASASLQTQITQNAAGIQSTATKVQEIDETANSAAQQAEAAQSAAKTAQQTADTAKQDAKAAQSAANIAASAATAAQNEADAAKAAAQTAQTKANEAAEELETAKNNLESVTSRVGSTEDDIKAAQEAVTAAQNAADKAQEDAEAAANKATTAQNAANTAATNAANAQTAADNAAQAASAAQATADAAKGDAKKAQDAADAARTAATNAQNTADTAAQNAATAQTKANEAAQTAQAAQSAADAADSKAAQAAQDLETAKQNLENVTSRVGATEEEIQAAQEAVQTAQAAADKAKQDAATAQSTANTAKTNAANAQSAANTAKAAADAAQADADKAKAAADAAQKDVDDLAVRVTKTETDIVQTSERIKLLATKEEVTQTLGGYYTKSQAEAQIQLKADEINQTVSETYTERSSAVAGVYRYYCQTDAALDDGGVTQVLLEETLTFDAESMMSNESFNIELEAGKTYTVIWNGAEYQCEAVEIDDGDTTGVVLGNYGFMTGGEITDEPFIVVYVPGHGIGAFALDGSAEARVSIMSDGGGVGDTLTWDGNTDGLETFEMEGDVVYKVSDATPSASDFANGGTVTISFMGQTMAAPCVFGAEEMPDIGGIILVRAVIEETTIIPIVVFLPGNVLGATPGLYLATIAMNEEDGEILDGVIINSLTINGYTGFGGGGGGIQKPTTWPPPAPAPAEPVTGSDTLTWDGNTDGLEPYTLDDFGGMTFYRISDTAPTPADFEKAGTGSIGVRLPLIQETSTRDFTVGETGSAVIVARDSATVQIVARNVGGNIGHLYYCLAVQIGNAFGLPPGFYAAIHAEDDQHSTIIDYGYHLSFFTLDGYGKFPGGSGSGSGSGSDTVTWDGSTVGRVTSTGGQYCKVSSAILTEYDFLNGGFIAIPGLATGAVSFGEFGIEMYDDGALNALFSYIKVIPFDGYDLGTSYGVFPEAGTYFLIDYEGRFINRLTLNGYTGFETTGGPLAWTETQPPYEPGKNLYTVDCTVYADGSFVYSDVSASAAQEGANLANAKALEIEERVTNAETAITQTAEQISLTATKLTDVVNGIQIGGRNLLKGTKEFAMDGGESTLTGETYNGLAIRRLAATASNVGRTEFAVWRNFSDPFRSGERYTISFYARSDTEETASRLQVSLNGATMFKSYRGEGLSEGIAHEEWKRLWFCFVADSTIGQVEQVLTIFFNQDASDTLQICGVKFEKGNRATDWTPAPEDVDEKIVTLESAIEQNAESITLRVTRDELGSEVAASEEKINKAAQEAFASKSDYDDLKEWTESELKVTNEGIAARASEIIQLGDESRGKFEEIHKFLIFTTDGLTIKAGENTMSLVLDNDRISFRNNEGTELGWWDGNFLHTGNIFIDVSERARFGNFAFVPRSDGSLSFLKVGG